MKIALIAHDKKKNEIIEIAKVYKDVLAGHELYATGTTGTLIMGETGLPIHRMKSGPLGGDQQIGAMLANGENLVSEVPKHFYTLFTEQYIKKCELASKDNFIIDADFAILVLNGK